MSYLKFFLKRSFSTQTAQKFPESTIAGAYKKAVRENYMVDAVRFDSQKINWTLKEFDKYSSAFAFGLVESGFQRGDKLLLWADQTHSAELLVTQMGAFKAGVSIVTFDEKDSIEALDDALQKSNARGILFSPQTSLGETNKQRESFLTQLMPELNKLYPGDELNLNRYPQLKQIVQLGHKSLKGVIKFRDAMVYAVPKFSIIQLPENQPGDQVYESYQNGNKVAEFTSAEIVNKANHLWNNHLSSSGLNSPPVFMSLSLENPLAVSVFLGCSSNLRKVVIPSSFNASAILQCLKVQNSDTVVIDSELFQLEPPQGQKQQINDMCASVTKAVVGNSSNSASIGSSEIFSRAKPTHVNVYSVQDQ